VEQWSEKNYRNNIGFISLAIENLTINADKVNVVLNVYISMYVIKREEIKQCFRVYSKIRIK
jgi:hypothetical protein